MENGHFSNTIAPSPGLNSCTKRYLAMVPNPTWPEPLYNRNESCVTKQVQPPGVSMWHQQLLYWLSVHTGGITALTARLCHLTVTYMQNLEGTVCYTHRTQNPTSSYLVKSESTDLNLVSVIWVVIVEWMRCWKSWSRIDTTCGCPGWLSSCSNVLEADALTSTGLAVCSVLSLFRLAMQQRPRFSSNQVQSKWYEARRPMAFVT